MTTTQALFAQMDARIEAVYVPGSYGWAMRDRTLGTALTDTEGRIDWLIKRGATTAEIWRAMLAHVAAWQRAATAYQQQQGDA